ncbi:MAG TPA: fasciclin domain-containing protein [Sunxiuqinia sp.]|nr:fasciclin domain-containing protein [Sunxiuqinia sp.]
MKRKIIFPVISFIGVLLLFSACNKAKEDYYKRPTWLEPPIYQQLQDKGNFTDYLALVDEAGFKETLSKAGYYTVFAPNDDAFSRYFQKEGISSVDQIDSLTAQGIVRYSIVYNAFFKDALDDYQNSSLDTTQTYDVAFKRRTMYYKWVYNENVDGTQTKVIDQNGVPELPDQGIPFSSDDNNNKHIPYFTDNFFATKGLSSYDYNYFFPDKEFTGFNVYDAKVVAPDLRAENGVIQVVDEVIPPLPSLEDYITKNPDYSAFYDLIKQYMLRYTLAPQSFLDRYAQYNGSSANVYIKMYPNLNFGLNCENFMKYASSGSTYDAQKDGWTIFAPNNAATNDFIQNKLLQHYPSIDVLPTELIAEFINAHLFRTTVWPSHFQTTTNYYGEPARFDPESNIIEKEIGSNGMFYGTNIVQKTDAFYTVLGQVILDPQYSLMTQALKSSNIYDILKNPKLKMTIFLLKNSDFENLGLNYDGSTNSWELTNPDLGTNATLALNRIVKMNMFLGDEYTDFKGNGLLKTYSGEYVRYQNGVMYGAGNYQKGQIVFPFNQNTDATNGITYSINKPLYYSTKEIGYDIELNQNSFSEYYKYLKKAAQSLPGFIYDLDTKIITSIKSGEMNTLLIPCDTAIEGAVRDGYLPPITAQNFTQDQLQQVSDFINYHCINGQIIVPGSGFDGTARTLYQTSDGATFLHVTSSENDLTIIDDYNRDVHLIYNKSDILSNNAIIHVTDNYLKYKK